MTLDIALVLFILTLAILLFLTDKLRPDIIAMLVMTSLILTGVINFEEAFTGFANPAVITVGAILVISQALFQTGVADFLSNRILHITGHNEVRIISIIMVSVGIMSAVMNNIGATAVFLPAVMSIARETKISPSRLLIPLSFASLMGGNLSLIGTPPNILASAALRDYYGVGFSFFDFTPMGLIILGSGTLYMVFIGRHLLPDHAQEDITATYRVKEYLSEIEVLPDSPIVGKTIMESRFGEAYDLAIMGIVREGKTNLSLQPDDRIKPNDTLLVRGSLDRIIKVRSHQSLAIKQSKSSQTEIDLTSPKATLAEVLLVSTSNFAGSSLRDLRFRQQYRLTVIALQRQDHLISTCLGDEPLRGGDILLVQGKREYLNLLRINPNFLLLEPVSLKQRRTEKAPIALGILTLLLIAVTMDWLHISVGGVIAALLMVLFKVLTAEEAYQAIEWKAVFFIAGMLSLGQAMEATGSAEYLASLIIESMADLGTGGILLGIYLLTALLTQLMSNSAATVLVAPIGINIALGLGADPRPFLMTTVVAASTIFLTPIGHASNILVFGPGRYKFLDFTKVGLGLMLMYMLITVIVLPQIWPLFP